MRNVKRFFLMGLLTMSMHPGHVCAVDPEKVKKALMSLYQTMLINAYVQNLTEEARMDPEDERVLLERDEEEAQKRANESEEDPVFVSEMTFSEGTQANRTRDGRMYFW